MFHLILLESNYIIFLLTANQTPFQVGVVFDENEITTGDSGTSAENKHVPGGIIGFKLTYFQRTC